MKSPIILISFNRTHYLERVVESLKAQRHSAMKDREVFVFQDGSKNFRSGKTYADNRDLYASSLTTITALKPAEVFVSARNIGIGLNFRRAEAFAFEQRRYPAVIFMEDDMVLGPDYLAIMDHLLDQILGTELESKVGQLAAYGRHRAPIARQRERQHEIVSMEQSWGFAMTRTAWLAIRDLMEPYEAILESCDYKRRPKKLIVRHHKRIGLHSKALSQDEMKRIAVTAKGMARIMPFPCHARYIGEHGSNFTPDIFIRKGYGSEEILDYDWRALRVPDGERLTQMAEELRANLSEQCDQKLRHVKL